MPDRMLEVLDAGALTTIQDLGRPGFAHLGVPRSGALDQPALRLANRLVGNPESAAVLETTATGVRFRVDRAGAISVTGARCEVRVDGRSVPWGAALAVPAGAVVQVGPAAEGLRSYVAVAGGLAVPAVLGSRSTDLLSGLGPAPLSSGDLLALGQPEAEPSGTEAVPRALGAVLGILLGPRQHWFSEPALAGLDGATYEVDAASNRIGLRLRGAVLDRSRTGELPRDLPGELPRELPRELPSEPIVLGAVQVPPNGQPVVFLADHPTTGGYPVIAVVRQADLPVCAQARPGDRVTFRVLG